jgi:hypothetical protein
VAKSFSQQHNVRVEVDTDKKIVDLRGYSEEAIRLSKHATQFVLLMQKIKKYKKVIVTCISVFQIPQRRAIPSFL